MKKSLKAAMAGTLLVGALAMAVPQNANADHWRPYRHWRHHSPSVRVYGYWPYDFYYYGPRPYPYHPYYRPDTGWGIRFDNGSFGAYYYD